MSRRAKSWIRTLGELAVAVLGLAVASSAYGVDGITEINHVRALGGGVTPVDAPGYPVTLGSPGSYRLTGNLYSGDSGVTVLEIAADRVTVDLNGFEIAPCPPGVGCGTSGPEGYGVGAVGFSDVAVRDGAVRDMRLDGVRAGDRARVEDVHAIGNGSTGAYAGIRVGLGSRVVGNTVTGSGGWGLVVGSSSAVEGNQVIGNGGGIQTLGSCTVLENRVSSNVGEGLSLTFNDGYRDNVLEANAGGSISGGRPLGMNLCNGASCNSPPRRRFYLTTTTHDGAGADEDGVCAAGFHFASMWEIWNPSGLQYDAGLGQTTDDAGSGPPVASGWVRTGIVSNGSSAGGYMPNCNAWTSADPAVEGTGAWLDPYWIVVAPAYVNTEVLPWLPLVTYCDVHRPVWCVQD